MNSWTSVASSLSFANWFSDDESLRIGGRAAGDARGGAGGGRRGRKVKSELDSPDSSSAAAAEATTTTVTPPSSLLLLRLDATLPPIVVRNLGGKELDTDTSYQRSLRRARVKCLLGLPLSSSEWQLPHVSAPSRPDYSRVIPPPPVAKFKRSPRPVAAAIAATEQLAIAGSSGHLESRPASPRLNAMQLVPLPPIRAVAPAAEATFRDVVYASFVAGSVLHQRNGSSSLQHEDVRAVLTDYQFPGWCYGCRLLHERPPTDTAADNPSYNPFRDRPVRVGGGYAYVIRRPDSDAGARRDVAVPAPPQVSIAPPVLGGEGNNGTATVKRSQSAFDLRAIDRLPRIVDAVRGKHICLLRRRGAWLRDDQLQTNKLRGANQKESEPTDSECLSGRMSQPVSTTGAQKAFVESAQTGSEKDYRTQMQQKRLLYGTSKSSDSPQDDSSAKLEATLGHLTSSNSSPQLFAATHNASAQHSPFTEVRVDRVSAMEPLEDSLDDGCVSFTEKISGVSQYLDLLQKQAVAPFANEEGERIKSAPSIEEHSPQYTSLDVQRATAVAENTSNNVANTIADASPEDLETLVGLQGADESKQPEEVTMHSLLEEDETTSLASSFTATKDEPMENATTFVGAAGEESSCSGSSSSGGSSSSSSNNSSSNTGGSHSSLNSANCDSHTSGKSQGSKSGLRSNNGSAVPFAAAEMIHSEHEVIERNFASEKTPASPSEATVAMEAGKQAGDKDVQSPAKETVASSVASDDSAVTVEEATPAAVLAQKNPGTADDISTSQRNLEELLHSTVQVSSWKQDTAIIAVAASQPYQEAQVLAPSVITIPTDQARTETHSVVTDLMVDEPKNQSVRAIRTRDMQDMPTPVITTVDNVDHIETERISGSSAVSPQQDTLRSVQSRSKSLLRPMRQPPGARHRKSVAALTATSEGAEFSDDTNPAKPVEEESTRTKSHPALLERPSKISAADATKEASPPARKKPEMKTVARKKDKVAITNQAQDDEAATHGGYTDLSAEPTSPIKTTSKDNVLLANSNKTGGTATHRNSDEKTALKSTEQARSPVRNKEPMAANDVAKANQHEESNKVTTKKASTARKAAPPAPAEKPNFMHLLSIGTASEDEPADPSPIAQTPASPEMEFVIQREPTTPEPSESPSVLVQPVPTVTEKIVEPQPPPPPPAVKKEPLPPPPQIAVGPPPQVVSKRLRALKLFESRGRVVSLVQRRSEISSPTRRDLLRAGADPVDYLTKYCLIHSDRLPYYERVFREVVTHQHPRLESLTNLISATGTTAAADGSKQPQKKANEPTERQKKLLRLAAQLPAHTPRCREPAINAAEFQAARVQYTMERLQARYEQLVIAIEQLEQERNQALASAARVAYPEILAADYKPSSGKRKRSPKRKKRSPSPGKTPRTSMLPDSQVLERLSASQRENLTGGDKNLRGMTVRLERMEEQCVTAELRAAELEAEKEEMKNWAKELFARQQTTEKLTAEFRLSQTQFFNRLHPLEDLEMNLEELEYALQLINNHLITDKERKYIYHVLDIPGTTRINLKLFSCIAALSEKVHQLDPIVRKLINKLDYEALEIKMEACKEMFFLLADRSPHNGHHIQLSDLGVELAAGGLSAETVRYVIGRLDFMSTGQVEYLDFLMYIPLFLEIHQKIVKEPLGDRSPRRVSSVGK